MKAEKFSLYTGEVGLELIAEDDEDEKLIQRFSKGMKPNLLIDRKYGSSLHVISMNLLTQLFIQFRKRR